MILKNLQQKLTEKSIPSFVVTMNNMFFGQDILKEENKILELSGFTGSAGTLFVTPDKAWLFVDGRYELQAKQQVNETDITVVASTNVKYDLQKVCHENKIDQIGYNPWCVSVQDVNFFQNSHTGKQIQLIEIEDLMGQILSDKTVNVFEHELKYAGKTAAEKCLEAGNLIPYKFDAMLITAADKVSWLTNLRSHSLAESPILRAYALLDRSGSIKIYTDNCVHQNIKPLCELATDLSAYKGKYVLINTQECPQKIFNLAPKDVYLESGYDPLIKIKTAKNPIELEGFKNSHIRDGVAVVKFLCWFEKNWHGKTELDVVCKLKEFRQQQPLFFSDSFSTIAATGANAAIVHYQPSQSNHKPLQENSVLLLDSGAQYYDGTTDVTRTIALGNPMPEIKENFTQVLKAHISLSSAQVPDDANAFSLDSIARHKLWNYGKDYKHSTGHSVGHFSNVHESTFNIGKFNYIIHENYVTSIEPGYYKEGEYGIRIENMVYTTPSKSDGFLKFIPLTLIPIDKRLIDKYLLSIEEQAWINNYHQEVFNHLAQYLDAVEKNWLKDACSPL